MLHHIVLIVVVHACTSTSYTLRHSPIIRCYPATSCLLLRTDYYCRCVQEYFLHALSQPRPHASLDLMQQQCKDQLGNAMRRSQSYHGLDPLGIPSAVYGAMHDIHASFIQAAPFGKKPKRQPSFAALPQSKRGSFRSSDGMTAPAVPCPGGGAPAGSAAHPVLSMLAEQVSQLQNPSAS